MATIRFPPDFKEFLKLLGVHEVEYLLIGGYAVGYHGYPRATGDMRYRTIGTARTAPTATLKSMPILTSIARLDRSVSLLMVVAPWYSLRHRSRLLVSGPVVSAPPARRSECRRRKFVLVR